MKAEVSVRYHVDDIVTRTTVQLPCDADEGTASSNNRGDEVGDDCSLYPSAEHDEHMESESEEELGDTSTLHYQRLRRAEEAWSKVRETALLTTLQSEGSLFGKKCFFCSSVASSRCLDCSPLMSFCESCAVDKDSSIGNGGTSAFLDGANSLPIVLFKKWGKSLGIKMEFFETALDLD